MRCFSFLNLDKRDGVKKPKSGSNLSGSSLFTDFDSRRTGSDTSSQNVSDTGTSSRNVSDAGTETAGRRSPLPALLQRPSTLRVFTVSDLKLTTRNFSRSVMIGEGGFGCVYKGFIKSPEDPSHKIEVAIKQLSKKGIQVKFIVGLHRYI